MYIQIGSSMLDFNFLSLCLYLLLFSIVPKKIFENQHIFAFCAVGFELGVIKNEKHRNEQNTKLKIRYYIT